MSRPSSRSKSGGGSSPQRPTRPTTRAGRDAANAERMARKAENRALNREAWEAEIERRAAIRAAREARLGPREPRSGSTLEVARQLVATAPDAVAVQALRVLAQLESEQETIRQLRSRVSELEDTLSRVDPNTLTPEQRVVLSMADPVHGPLLRQAALELSEREEQDK